MFDWYPWDACPLVKGKEDEVIWGKGELGREVLGGKWWGETMVGKQYMKEEFKKWEQKHPKQRKKTDQAELRWTIGDEIEGCRGISV